jgi:hypothetical protein
MTYGIIVFVSLILGGLVDVPGLGLVIGLLISLCLFLWHKHGAALKAWHKERKAAKTASPGAPAPAKEKSTDPWKGVWKIVRLGIALALIGWSWYSIENEVGFPGTYVATKSYDHSVPLVLDNLQDRKLCGIEPGKWRFEFPQQAALEQIERHRKTERAGFYIRTPSGDTQHFSAVSNIMVNGIFSGKEKVTVGPDGCVTVSVFTTQQGKEEAEMLGGPVVINGKYLTPGRQSVPQPFTVQIRFY